MKKSSIFNKKIYQTAIALLLSVTAVMLFAGCSMGPGLLKPDAQATSFFDTATLPSGYNYYTSSLKSSPDVIIAISKKYKLDTFYWKPIKLNSAEAPAWLKTAVINNPCSYELDGGAADIIGPQGQKIGKWYSVPGKYYSPTTVMMVGPKDVQISVPITNTQSGMALLYRNWGISGTYY